MTTYATGNPLGSAAPPDLYDNSQNLDFAMNNRFSRTWTDRFGVGRMTFRGFELEAADVLQTLRGTRPRGDWAPNTAYALNDIVSVSGSTITYQAVVAHTSGTTFQTDLDSGRWVVYKGITAQDLAQPNAAAQIGYSAPGAGATPGKVVDIAVPRPQQYGGVSDGVTNDNAAVQNLKTQALADRRPVMVPKATLHSVDLVGVERVQTAYYEDREVDFAQAFMSQAYAGAAVTIECHGDSTMWGADTANLATQAPEPAPARLQYLLRTYYRNDSIVVQNKAISGGWIRQMLEGSGLYAGVGSFENAMKVSTASIIICNHCINTVQTFGTAQQFKRDYHEAIEIARKYGKTFIIATPVPPLPVGLGDRRKVEQMKEYVALMRQVAAEASCLLVDNYEIFSRLMNSGDVTQLTTVPDGIHGANLTYTRYGQNLALPLVGQAAKISRSSPFVASMAAAVNGFAQSNNVVISNRTGGALITNPDAGQVITALIEVTEPGLDIYVGVPLWAAGAAAVTISVDRVPFSLPFSFLSDWKNPSTYAFIHDHEILVMENATPGLHMIEMRADGGLGLHHVRARPTTQRRFFNYQTGFSFRDHLFSRLEHQNFAPDSVFLMDDFPSPRNFPGGFECEFKADLRPNTGVVFNGGYAIEPAATGNRRSYAGYIVGADETGKLAVWENQSGVNVKIYTGTQTVGGNTSVTEAAAGMIYARFNAPSNTYPNGQLILFYAPAGGGYGTPAFITLTQPYLGGLMGTWNSNGTAGGVVMQVYNCWRINRGSLLIPPPG